MSRPYRTASKRIIHRTGGGRFRRSTLADIGMACCEKCGVLFAPERAERRDGFIDPLAFNNARRLCPDHSSRPERPVVADLHEVFIEGSDGPVVLPEPVAIDTPDGNQVCGTEGCDGGREVAVDCPNVECLGGERALGVDANEYAIWGPCPECNGYGYIAGTCYLEHEKEATNG